MFYLTKMKKIISFTFLLLCCSGIGAKRDRGMKVSHEITWDPRFTEELGFGMVHQIEVRMNEYMDIFCPQYDADAPSTLMFIIYNVSKQSFDQCVVTEDSRRIFSCDQPSISKKLTTKFQKRSPNPLGFVYHPGHTYYYLALVQNQEIKSGNPCDQAMRMSIEVRPKLAHDHTTTTRQPKPTTKTTTTTTTTLKPTTTTTPSTETIKRTTSIQTTTTKKQQPVVNSLQQTGGGGGGGSNRINYSVALLWLSLLLTWLLQR